MESHTKTFLPDNGHKWFNTYNSDGIFHFECQLCHEKASIKSLYDLPQTTCPVQTGCAIGYYDE